MALTHARALEVARYGKDVSDALKASYSLMTEFLKTNSDISIDWANATIPAGLVESVDGNIDGLTFTRQQLSNAIGTFAAIQTLLLNGHLGNLNQIANARSGA